MTVVFIQWLHLSLSQVLSEFQAAFVQFQSSLFGLVLNATKKKKPKKEMMTFTTAWNTNKRRTNYWKGSII